MMNDRPFVLSAVLDTCRFKSRIERLKVLSSLFSNWCSDFSANKLRL